MAKTDRKRKIPDNGQVLVSLPSDYIREIDEYADKNGLSRSAVLRMRLMNSPLNNSTQPQPA